MDISKDYRSNFIQASSLSQKYIDLICISVKEVNEDSTNYLSFSGGPNPV